MCGIFGYIGKKQSDLSGFLLSGLRKLEYRGYDSAGIAVLDKKKVRIFKAVGEVEKLSSKLKGHRISGRIGLGHTRWATHGGVTIKNAHPHYNEDKTILLVHNGIVENYEELKKYLVKKGHRFVSETDTEIIVHLIEEEKGAKSNSPIKFAQAVRSAFQKLTGLNALVVASVPAQCLLVFRQGSPLSIGKMQNSFIASSDLPTLTDYTHKIFLLDEKEGALLLPEGKAIFFDKNGKKFDKKPHIFHFQYGYAEKGRYAHFMLKEIHEQTESLARILTYPKDLLSQAASCIRNAYGTYFTACGTASYAGLAATYLFSHIASRHVNFAPASEFYFLEDFLVPQSLLIVASQSGETIDTLEAVRAAKKHGSQVLALVNVPGSTLTRLADLTLELLAGPEKAVASTKSYTAKLALFLLIAYTLAGRQKEGFCLIEQAQKAVRKILQDETEKMVQKLADRILEEEHLYIIGRGVNYPTALEAALKVKEVSYMHAEGFAGGELKHGVIALVRKGTPCLAFVANDESKEAVLANAAELKSRGGFLIGIGSEADEIFDWFIKVPDVGIASPIVNVVPAQLLAYWLAVKKGYNPDKPRNLAKSVVVK